MAICNPSQKIPKNCLRVDPQQATGRGPGLWIETPSTLVSESSRRMTGWTVGQSTDRRTGQLQTTADRPHLED
uniref:Uncharacterized protein n=1 Tax=Solanum tuberosum TaxID=4113 RepID=M1DU45_SOLTU